VVRLLAEYLRVSCPVGWPGTDGLTLEEVVGAAYPAAVTARLVPDLEELVKGHVELADAINAFFSPVVSE
jgi:hypothetical protein